MCIRDSWKREQVVGCEVYVDDWRGHSLVVCEACLDSLPGKVFRVGFEPAKDRRRYLDMKASYVQRRPGTKPSLVLRPVLKNDLPLRGKQSHWTQQAIAPWWSPYSVHLLAGIFYGYLIRYRQIILNERARINALGLMTSEYIFLGYR